MNSPILLIANPAAKTASERKIHRAAELIRAAGHEVNLYLTCKRGDAESAARKAVEDGISLIIAAGGDGTINEALNGIVHSKTVLAILPMGTTNVLAKELGIPENVDGAIRLALSGNINNVCAGKISLMRPSPVSRHFLLMAGIGFDGEAVYSFNQSVKKLSGKGAYVFSGLRTLINFNPEPLTFTVDGEAVSGYSAIIGNAAKYGGNFKVTPDASLIRPELQVCIMQGRRRRDVLRYLGGILTKTHLRYKDVVYRKALSVEVTGDAHVQIDGDYAGKTPAIITAEPYALRLIF